VVHHILGQQQIAMKKNQRAQLQELEALLHRQIAYMIAEGFAVVELQQDGTTTLRTTTQEDIEAEVARIAAL
jgi:hypothetical protein